MPTYEYECGTCGKRFEKFQGMNDKPLEICPHCGKTVRRIIGTGGGIIFKGSGFHATDYGNSPDRSSRCGREKPCCGRDEPCDRPPCDD